MVNCNDFFHSATTPTFLKLFYHFQNTTKGQKVDELLTARAGKQSRRRVGHIGEGGGSASVAVKGLGAVVRAGCRGSRHRGESAH